MTRDEILRKLKRLMALAERGGTQEEANAANIKLAELMIKHDITDEELSDTTQNVYEFKHANNRERSLLMQVAYKVFGEWEGEYYNFMRNGRKRKNVIGFNCTMAQKVEIDLLFDFYNELYKDAEKMLFSAFVNKHALVGTSTECNEPSLSPEELQKMLTMMQSLDAATPYKRIEQSL